MSEDDETAVNLNVSGNGNKLLAMFESKAFPNLEETVQATKLNAAPRAGKTGPTNKGRKNKKRESQSSTKHHPKARDAQQEQISSLTRSYSSVAAGTTQHETGTSGVERPEPPSTQAMIANMYQLALKNEKEMAIQCKELSKARTQLAIAQSANNEYAHQVQCLSMNNRILSEQMSSICSIMETLTKASSCNDSTLSSLSDAIATLKQMQAVKLPPSIPKEVVTNGRGPMDATAGKKVTPDKFTEETGDNKQQESMTAEGSKPAAMKFPP
jgi:hypothetical protein